MTVRSRSPSPSSGPSKKAKIEKQTQKDITLPTGEVLDNWHEAYEKSTPYKHAVVPGLLTDELVRTWEPCPPHIRSFSMDTDAKAEVVEQMTWIANKLLSLSFSRYVRCAAALSM